MPTNHRSGRASLKNFSFNRPQFCLKDIFFSLKDNFFRLKDNFSCLKDNFSCLGQKNI
jgi:hypothetical protein